MADPNPLSAPDPAATAHRLGTAESRALLRECFLQFRTRLIDMARSSLDLASDLFEYTRIADAEVENFRAKRGVWLERFGAAIDDMYEKRIAGQRRKGRRPDATAQGVGVKMLTDDDQKKQTAITKATQELERFVRIEAAALDQRFNALMPDRTSHEIDNPFSPAYVLDAMGMTSRAVYPESLVWRSLMERLIVDMTPGVNKIYIAINRFLGDHGVLPEISAAMRARSEYRPDEDAELLPVFKRLLAHAGDAEPATQPSHEHGTLPHATVVASIAALAKSAGARPSESSAPAGQHAGQAGCVSGSRSVARAGRQRRLHQDADRAAARAILRRSRRRGDLAFGAPDDARVPRNLVPSVRDALGDALRAPGDRTTADVVALLFDYIFRDVSHARPDAPRIWGGCRSRSSRRRSSTPRSSTIRRIPPAAFWTRSRRRRWARPVTRRMPKRWRSSRPMRSTRWPSASRSTSAVPARAEADRATRRGRARKKAVAALAPAIAAAASAENVEAERGRVRGTVRDRLSGLDVPGAVRAFAETIWTDYLTKLLKEHGEHAVATAGALTTLDDLVWSVAAKERTGQKQRLAKMIPALVTALRKGCAALDVPAERSKAFLDELYHLHIAAIKVPGAGPVPGAAAMGPAHAAKRMQPRPPGVGLQPRTRMVLSAAHDFVSEMVPGTWLEFRSDAGPIPARLAWTGSLRMRYVFSTRSGTQVFVRAPEELVHALVTGPVALLLEPVSLFDRAVSAALNVLAARRPEGAEAATAG